MLKSELKVVSLLVFFCLLLSEYLTWTTLGLVIFSSGMVLLKVRVPRFTRTVVTLGIFASYVLIYGKVIDPEVGLNFLTSVITLKILERESRRDQYMIFFGLILLFSAGALFEKTLTYACFYAFAFVVLVFDLYSVLDIRWRLKELLISTLWVMPLTGALFFLAPRMISPMGFRSHGQTEGKVGYAPDLNVSEVDQLSSNDQPVFHAVTDRKLSQRDLYWRGNVLILSDGWNWRSEKERATYQFPAEKISSTGIRQQIYLLSPEDYFFGLDYPDAFVSEEIASSPGRTGTITQLSRYPVSRYEVVSVRDNRLHQNEKLDQYSSVILSNKDKEFIRSLFPGNTVAEVTREVQAFFQRENFSYSLAPGKIRSIREFFAKRTGFCSHYASALGIILRVKGFPVRLVSGFMGGTHNQFADYYLITQNDAHVWVEALQDGKWVKYDPTEWVAPLRVELGGEAFADATSKRGPLAAMGLRFNYGFLQDARLWFNQWDFHFYRWLDQMDYYGQIQLLSKFKIKKQWVYYLIPGLILLFFLTYLWFMRREPSHQGPASELEKVWKIFLRKLKGRGIEIYPVSVEESSRKIRESEDCERNKLESIFQRLVTQTFAASDSQEIKSLRKEVRKL